MAPHSSSLAWKTPWMEEPGGLQSMGSRRVGQDWAPSLSLFTFMHRRKKWQPTPVFLPGESQGWGSQVDCHPPGVIQSWTRLKWLSSSSSSNSHNLHFKIAGLARRFNPTIVLRQDTSLLYKECRGKKVKSLSFLPPWVFQTSLSLGTPRLLINLPRKWLSQGCLYFLIHCLGLSYLFFQGAASFNFNAAVTIPSDFGDQE